MPTFLPSEYQECKTQAERVYSHLLADLSQARTVYVGGTKSQGESEFLCQLYPDLVFVDDFYQAAQGSTTLHGRPVITTVQLARQAGAQDFLINNSLTPAGFAHFQRQAESLGLPHCAVVEALSAHFHTGTLMRFSGLTSVYGPQFHRHTLDNLDLYARLRRRFAHPDALSLRTFDHLVRYRLTGDPALLHRVGVGYNGGSGLRHDAYILNAQFITLGEDEVFIDAGALNGDSCRGFINAVQGRFERIVMFEPAPDNARQCRDAVAALEQRYPGSAAKMEVVESGLYDRQGSLSLAQSLFDQAVTERTGVLPQAAHILDTGLSSSFAAQGNEYQVVEVPVTTLDAYLSGGKDRCTFIKMEIEGSEVAALDGARKTILKNRPKMALSIYHRPQDLELIMDYVENLSLGYRIALRAHNPWCPDAIVLYCW